MSVSWTLGRVLYDVLGGFNVFREARANRSEIYPNILSALVVLLLSIFLCEQFCCEHYFAHRFPVSSFHIRNYLNTVNLCSSGSSLQYYYFKYNFFLNNNVSVLFKMTYLFMQIQVNTCRCLDSRKKIYSKHNRRSDSFGTFFFLFFKIIQLDFIITQNRLSVSPKI